jgi:pimeloyl-ACP methyl ester carboxylesterase
MASSPYSPGDHTFETASTSVSRLSYTIVPSTKPDAPLMVIQAVGWGPGRTLYTRSLAPLFTDHYTVLTFSPRGSDESSRPKDAEGNDDASQMSSASMREDLESLRTYLKFEAFPVLMGHSHGGCLALQYAQSYPNRVEKLVVIDGQVLGADGSATFKKFAEERALQEPWKKAYETWGSGYPTTDEEFGLFLTNILPSYFSDPDRHCETVIKHLEGSPLKIWCFQSQNRADMHDKEKMIPLMKEVKAKVLCSYGKEDMICGVEVGEMIVEQINAHGGKAELAVFEHCGHFPWVEKKEEFLESTLKFLGV